MVKVQTPCIGVCSTVFGDLVCRGCKRFSHEIIDWNGYSVEQKQLVLERLHRLTDQVLATKLDIQDEALFKKTVLDARIKVDRNGPLTSWVFPLFRALPADYRDFSEIGILLLPDYREKSAGDMKAIIHQEVYLLSSAIFDANHKRALSVAKNASPPKAVSIEVESEAEDALTGSLS